MDTTNGNNQTSLVIKRQVQVEAISKAVYLITNLFKDTEPLKMSLRRAAVECVECDDKKGALMKLHSLVRLSSEVNLVSEMNAGLLIRVIKEQLKHAPVDEASSVSVKDVLDTAGNGEEADIPNGAPVATLMAIENKERVELVKDMPVAEKKTHSITINHNTQNIKTVNNISMDIGSRRKRILEIVKARGAVTINEFIEAIKGISSKTIQRELTSLVLSGTLKKTGERRWSKYSLK